MRYALPQNHSVQNYVHAHSVRKNVKIERHAEIFRHHSHKETEILQQQCNVDGKNKLLII